MNLERFKSYRTFLLGKNGQKLKTITKTHTHPLKNHYHIEGKQDGSKRKMGQCTNQRINLKEKWRGAWVA